MMNERLRNHVKRLYDESALQCSEGSAWEWEEKFAELIIKECAEVCRLKYAYADRISANVAMQFASAVKQHFGVH